jgi:hypothetical protein
MSITLSNGFTVRRVPAPHLVNGEPVRSLIDPIDHEIVITDGGDADELVDRTAEAVAEAIGLAKAVQGDGIEILGGVMPKCPLIPETPPRLPFSRPFEG